MCSYKAHAWVLSVAFVPPLLLGWRAWAARIPPVWTAAVLIIYVGLVTNIVYPFYSNPRRHIPQAGGDHFALGHFLMLIAKPPGLNLVPAIKHTPNDGLVLFHTMFYAGAVVALTSPEALAEVLQQKAYDFVKHDALRAFLEPLVGNGLITVEGKQHRAQRKILAPAFQGKQINNLVPVFWRKALEFTDTMSREMQLNSNGSEGRERTVEINHIASRVTLDIIGLASLGKDFETLQHAEDELGAGFTNILDPTNGHIGFHAFLTLSVSPKIAKYFLPKTDKYIRATSGRIHATCRKLLAEKKAELAKDSRADVDILSTLINDGSLDDEELLDQLLTFLIAGHETTASAMAWVTYELARRPEMQNKLRAEVRTNAAINSGTQTLTAIDLNALPYLHGVCMETLRLWPIVTGTSRVALRDTTIVGKPISKGQNILVPITAMNRSYRFWGEDAETFNPDRWIHMDNTLNGGSTSPYALLTFLHGPRSCIGQGFARNELKCLVAAMVSRYEISLACPHREIGAFGVAAIKPKDLLNPKMGLLLQLKDLQEQ